MSPLDVAWFLVVAAPALLVLLIALGNLWRAWWPRAVTQARMPGGRVSVVIAAREADAVDIEGTVRALLANEHPIAEVLIHHRHPSARLRSELAALCAEFSSPLVRLLPSSADTRNDDGEDNDVGGLDAAVNQASGEVVLLLDARTRLASQGIARIGSLFLRHEADLIGLCPAQQQRGASFVARLVLPFRVVVALGALPLRLAQPGARAQPWLTALAGPVIAARREALQAGLDAKALQGPSSPDFDRWCTAAHNRGLRVLVADGHLVAQTTRDPMPRVMRRRLRAEFAQATGWRAGTLAALALGVVWCFVLPYLTLVVALASGATGALVAGALGVFANLLLRTLGTLRYGHAWEGIVLQPLAALLFAALLAKQSLALLGHAPRANHAIGRTLKDALRPVAERISQHS